MKKGELLKLFRANGIVFRKHGANHDIYYSPITNRIVVVPRHAKELPTGTAEKIKRDAGI